jgi:hypothetical protein
MQVAADSTEAPFLPTDQDALVAAVLDPLPIERLPQAAVDALAAASDHLQTQARGDVMARRPSALLCRQLLAHTFCDRLGCSLGPRGGRAWPVPH